MKSYYEHNGITIYHGDCLETMQTLPAQSVDCVLTDPPFSSGARREANKGLRKSMIRGTDDADWFTTDSLTTNGFVWLMRECAVQWHRIVKPGGHILVFIDWRMHSPLSGAIESADLRHNGLLVWNKTHFGMGSCFRNQHELILHFSNGKPNPPQRMDVGNVLDFKPIRNGVHPTEKPVDLLRTLLSVVCPRNGVVLDCFMGSGPTLEAACREDCSAIGVDVDAKCCEIAAKRLQQEVLVTEAV